MVEDGAILGGKYRVGRTLGRGGMAVVFEAMHMQLGTMVAVKVLRDDLAKNQEVADRFLREARSAAALRGDHICRVMDFGTHDDGTPYIVMELLEGRDLASVLKEHDELEIGLAASYVLHACAAVAELHSQAMVHRDLKPGNLFVVQKLDGTPTIKILDFGIAKVVLPADFDLTSTANIMGSPAYMSPEQLRSAKNVDARSDIWSLGIVLYELVTGDKPFDGESITDLALAITTEPPKPMPRNIPTGFIEVVWKCLEKDVAKRFQNVRELAEALQPFAGSKQELVTSVGRVLASPKVVATATPKEKTTLGSASGVMLVRPSAKPLIWIAAVLGVAAIAFVIALSMGGKSDEPPPPAAEPVAKPAPAPTPPTPPPTPPDAMVTVLPADAAWLAYEGDEPISVVWATPGTRIGIWSMMTPARHRRKGGARAALTCALEALWDADTEGAFLFSTPAGRPFYEAAGFTAVDDATTWTRGASAEFLAAIGQPAR